MTAAKATPAHTPGPWIVAEHDRASNLYTIQAKDGIMIAKAKGHSAARIVACVNACEGMLPEVLDEYANEGGMFRVFGRHMAKRDEEIFALRAEVERVKGLLRFMVDAAYTEPGMQIYKAHIEEARKELSNN